jgi:hypothetical protein
MTDSVFVPIKHLEHILLLAAIIRDADGNHDKSASALAESILNDSRVLDCITPCDYKTGALLLELARVAPPDLAARARARALQVTSAGEQA